MFEFTDSPLDSLTHLVRFVLTQPLVNPIMKHTIVVNTNVTDEAITPTNTSLFPVDFSIPANKKLIPIQDVLLMALSYFHINYESTCIIQEHALII